MDPDWNKLDILSVLMWLRKLRGPTSIYTLLSGPPPNTYTWPTIWGNSLPQDKAPWKWESQGLLRPGKMLPDFWKMWRLYRVITKAPFGFVILSLIQVLSFRPRHKQSQQINGLGIWRLEALLTSNYSKLEVGLASRNDWLVKELHWADELI